jgi:DNA-binding CsgD family transcriptional regulator
MAMVMAGLNDLLERASASLPLARAESPQAATEEDAAEVWSALVAGRWMLISSFHLDGRRHLLLKRSDPRRSGPFRSLTERERQVLSLASLGYSNKLIGDALKIAPSTVATHLAQAAGKLGVGVRRMLVQIWSVLSASNEAHEGAGSVR